MKPYDKHLGIWRFGITLARRFRFSVKLGSLTLLLVLPILALTFALVQRQSKELAAAQAEGGRSKRRRSPASSTRNQYESFRYDKFYTRKESKKRTRTGQKTGTDR